MALSGGLLPERTETSISSWNGQRFAWAEMWPSSVEWKMVGCGSKSPGFRSHGSRVQVQSLWRSGLHWYSGSHAHCTSSLRLQCALPRAQPMGDAQEIGGLSGPPNSAFLWQSQGLAISQGQHWSARMWLRSICLLLIFTYVVKAGLRCFWCCCLHWFSVILVPFIEKLSLLYFFSDFVKNQMTVDVWVCLIWAPFSVPLFDLSVPMLCHTLLRTLALWWI